MSCVWNYQKKGKQYIRAVLAASTTESTEILETMTSTLIFGRRVLSTGTAQGHGLIGGKAQGRAAVEAEHQAEADEPVAGRADAKIHIFDVLHKPEKNGQRKLWQASFFPLVGCPHFDMEQQAHQKVAASGMTDSRFCRRKVLAISADMRNSSAVVRPVLISWWKSYRSRKKVART